MGRQPPRRRFFIPTFWGRGEHPPLAHPAHELKEGTNATDESRVIDVVITKGSRIEMQLTEPLISSPKRDVRAQTTWERFFPYYAGFPETFANDVLTSLRLRPGATVLDPWNGSGTTIYAAVHRGYKAVGLDLNPVMVIVSRARMLPFSEIDALEPLAKTILRGASRRTSLSSTDPLLSWFDSDTALTLRSIERSINQKLVGSRTLSADDVDLSQMSSVAATFYILLFAVARDLTKSFRSSNPTWIRTANSDDGRVRSDRHQVESLFVAQVKAMAQVLADDVMRKSTDQSYEIRVADSTSRALLPKSVDAVLTSPPYCTRIDYTAATRVELALIGSFVPINATELGRMMLGSTRVPASEIRFDESWGPSCIRFLRRVSKHPSKASNGYYLKTHLDYFDKIARSMAAISASLKPKALAVLVVQDSFYKDIHNDLPLHITQIAERRRLVLRQRLNFEVRRSMSGINPKSRNYRQTCGAVESVLCFERV